jgi:hypothetical protein
MLACMHRGAPMGAVAICRETRRHRRIKQSYPAFACAIHGRCLPALRAWQTQHEAAEARLYHLCCRCGERCN